MTHQPSKETRRIVEQMRSCGESHAVIARALKIDDDTLRKYYAEELLDGHAARRREIIGLMFKGARKGNASLIKRAEEMTRVAGALDGFGEAPVKAPKLGKKEQVREQAMNAGTDNVWGDDLKPPPDTLN